MKNNVTRPLSLCLHRTDGGRGVVRPEEKKDCTVRALAVATGESYEKCFYYLAGHGRVAGRGLIQEFTRRAYLALPGFTVDETIYEGRRHKVRTMLAGLNRGRFVVRVRGHVFAVVDGVICDIHPELNLNCRVLTIWRFTRTPVPCAD